MDEWVKFLLLPAVAALIWFVRLEGKQLAHERECAQRQKNLDERHKTITDTLQNIDQKLDRMMSER